MGHRRAKWTSAAAPSRCDDGAEEAQVDLSELIVYHRGTFRPYREATLGLLTHALQYGTGCFEGIRGF